MDLGALGIWPLDSRTVRSVNLSSVHPAGMSLLLDVLSQLRQVPIHFRFGRHALPLQVAEGPTAFHVSRDGKTASAGRAGDPTRPPLSGPMFGGLDMTDANALAHIVLKLRRREPSRQPQHDTLPLAAEDRRFAVGMRY